MSWVFSRNIYLIILKFQASKFQRIIYFVPYISNSRKKVCYSNYFKTQKHIFSLIFGYMKTFS